MQSRSRSRETFPILLNAFVTQPDVVGKQFVIKSTDILLVFKLITPTAYVYREG